MEAIELALIPAVDGDGAVELGGGGDFGGWNAGGDGTGDAGTDDVVAFGGPGTADTPVGLAGIATGVGVALATDPAFVAGAGFAEHEGVAEAVGDLSHASVAVGIEAGVDGVAAA